MGVMLSSFQREKTPDLRSLRNIAPIFGARISAVSLNMMSRNPLGFTLPKMLNVFVVRRSRSFLNLNV
jgi:hypothetical protein